tara:strand:- start:55 stop:990 length:936 start_codon:yes stop_codon:yes gene_type:complete
MYKANRNSGLENICKEISSWCIDSVQTTPFSESFNNFEVEINDNVPTIYWETSVSSSQQFRLMTTSSLSAQLGDNRLFSSSLDLDNLKLIITEIPSQSLHYLSNNLIDETITCTGYASTGSIYGFFHNHHEIARGLSNYLTSEPNYQEVDVDFDINGKMDTIVFTNSSSFDETLVYDWCDLNLIPTGSVKVVDVSQKNKFTSQKNHSYYMYGKGIGTDIINIYGKSVSFVSNYGNQLARKLAINEVKEGVSESLVEILYIEGDTNPKYIKITSDNVTTYQDVTPFTKEYSISTYGLTDRCSVLKQDVKHFN